MNDLSPDQLESLRLSELRFRRIFETAHDGILLLNADTGRVIAANPFICDLISRPEHELVGSFLWDLGPLKQVISSRENFGELQRKRFIRYEDVPLETPNGRVVHVEFISNVYNEGNQDIIQCNIRDTTDRFETQRKLEHYVRTLVTINQCNASLVHSYSEEALGNAICKALVINGGFGAAWFGLEEDVDDRIKLKVKGSSGLALSDISETLELQHDRNEDSELRSALKSATPLWMNSNLKQRLPRLLSMLVEKQGYTSCALIPMSKKIEVAGMLVVFCQESDRFDEEILNLLVGLTNDLGFGIADIRVRAEHSINQAKLLRSFDEAIAAIAATTELRDPYTAGHQARVATLAEAIASEMGLSSDTRSAILMAGGVHDIGKIQVPAEILSKPGKLTPAQFEIIKTHPDAGFQILKNISFTHPIAEIVLQHHERLDGSGYPQQLKGDQILLEAKIISVADTVEAMSSHRPYRAGLGIEVALKEIADKRGIHYDAEAVDACLRLFNEKGYKFAPM